jgi:hypothetical protein
MADDGTTAAASVPPYEAVTAATDALVALAALRWSLDLAREGSPWAPAFAAAAAGSAFGAAAHGLASQATRSRPFWRASLAAVVGAGGIGSAAAIRQRLDGRHRLLGLSLVGVKTVAALVLVLRDERFGAAMAAYGIDLVVLAALHREDTETDRLVRQAVVASAAAAAVQRSGWRRGRVGNHNDAYHMLQLIALWRLRQVGRAG